MLIMQQFNEFFLQAHPYFQKLSTTKNKFEHKQQDHDRENFDKENLNRQFEDHHQLEEFTMIIEITITKNTYRLNPNITTYSKIY